MGTCDLRTLLKCVPGIRHACDLDLLLFFFRHPRALLTSEQIVAAVGGYERNRITESLDNLIGAGLLTRSQGPKRTSQLYVLQLHSSPGGVLPSLLQIATTRLGRQETMRLLEPASTQGRMLPVGPDRAS